MQYAVIWELTVRTKSAAVFSLASLVRFLLMALSGPFIGGVVDRFDRKKYDIFGQSNCCGYGLVGSVGAKRRNIGWNNHGSFVSCPAFTWVDFIGWIFFFA